MNPLIAKASIHPRPALRKRIAVAVSLGTALASAISCFATEPEFLRLMRDSMMQMHAAMNAAPNTGDPDRDFALMMIPHHQGAVDMAKAELLYGKDPVMRRLAQEIIVDQESEIDAMKLRLAKVAGKAKK